MTAILPIPAGLAQRREAVFAPVAGQSPLVSIVRTLMSVGDVVVAPAAPLADEVRESLTRQGLSPVQVRVAEGPGRRAHCVAAGLRALGEAPTGPVLLHDIAWPLIAPATLDRVTAALRGGARAVLPICPVTDSIKAVDPDGAVTATVGRAPLRTVQYPRGFDGEVLSMLVAQSAVDEFDDLDAVLAAEVSVTLVDGETDTIRIELPGDADYLAAVITTRNAGSGR